MGSSETSVTRGRCLCGAVTYEFSGPEIWRAYCHCESCRRAISSPVAAFLGVPRAAFRFTGTAPAVYRSSPGVRRLFCARCGSPMGYESERWADEMHLYAASLEDPAAYRPQGHVHTAEQLPWFDVKDDLPRNPKTS